MEPGLRTLNQKEYDRNRHRKNYLKKHPNAGTLYNQNRDHIDQTGENNPNYKHGRALNGPNAEYQRWRRANLDKRENA